jgi:hypothetical protein
MVQGPVVSYGGAQNGGTPFKVSGPTPTGNTNEGSRVQSMRVWAVVIGVFGLACVAGVTVLALILIVPKMTDKPKEDPPVTVAKADPPKPTHVDRDDTGKPRPKQQDPAPTSKPRPRPTTTGTSAPPPQKPSATGTLTMSFSGTSLPTSVEVRCNGGFVDRKGVSGGSVTVANVPTADTCQAYPKGVVATAYPVHGGRSYSCSFTGTTTSCK